MWPSGFQLQWQTTPLSRRTNSISVSVPMRPLVSKSSKYSVQVMLLIQMWTVYRVNTIGVWSVCISRVTFPPTLSARNITEVGHLVECSTGYMYYPLNDQLVRIEVIVDIPCASALNERTRVLNLFWSGTLLFKPVECWELCGFSPWALAFNALINVLNLFWSGILAVLLVCGDFNPDT